MTRRGRARVASALLILTLGVWGVLLEPASLRNETYRLVLDRWPRQCSPLRVAVLADLHVGSPFIDLAKLDEIVALTQAARPDLILLTGDYVIDRVVGGRFVTPETIAAGVTK